MLERIKEIMEREQLNPAKFADTISIQRSAISHILAGRNRPSLDVIQKILYAFPTLNSDWLLKGKGKMYIDENPLMPSLWDAENLKKETTSPGDNENRKEKHSNDPSKDNKHTEMQSFAPISYTSKKVSKILVFYTDGTFDTFEQEKNSTLKF